jgi:hypothetical protein
MPMQMPLSYALFLPYFYEQELLADLALPSTRLHHAKKN